MSQNCCYGKGAAEDLKFTDLKSTSAFHVGVELSGKCDTIYFQIQNNLIFTFEHTYCRIITVLVESIVLDFFGSSAEICVNGNSEILINQSIYYQPLKLSTAYLHCMLVFSTISVFCFLYYVYCLFLSVHFGNLWGE